MPVSLKGAVYTGPPGNKSFTIKQKVFIPASPKKVYEAYLDGKKHSAMTGGAAELEPREGGSFSAWNGYIYGTICELEKGKKIVHDWITTDWPEGYPRSLLSLTFKPKDKGTEIHLVQEGVPAAQVKSYEKGWKAYYWTPMKKYFSGPKPVKNTLKSRKIMAK
jgi:activator of HSP90 ATPase